MLPLLGAARAAEQGHGMAVPVLVAIGTLVGLVVANRFILAPLFRIVMASRVRELSAAMALLVVLATAGVVEHVGLSMALGAFLAGVLLADSPYRHELEADIDPFKGLLLGLFFVAVGMSADGRVSLINGAVMFTADLMREIDNPVRLDCIRVSSYGSKTNGKSNDGINLAVPEGTPVKAAEDGVVAYSGNELKGYGNLVLVRHSNGYVTAYAHTSEIMVKRGDTIKRGQVIAKSGQTGEVGSPQLHFEIRKGSSAVDPLQFLNGA